MEKKGFEDSRIWKRKGSRSQGFEESSGERQKTEYRSQKSEVRRQEKVRGLEGWRFS